MAFKFLLDEDLPPKAAEVARGLGLDAVSVHEVSRAGRAISDPEQLRYAASQNRILVTRNRDDFIRHAVEFYRKGEATAGILIVVGGLPNDRPERFPPRSWHGKPLAANSRRASAPTPSTS